MSAAACALGVRTPVLDAEWRAFLREARPWGFVLFREACRSRPQVAALSQDLRDAVGRDAVVYIDQEGGRVARMRPPDWPVWPAAAAYGALYEKDKTLGLAAIRLGFRLIAHELKAVGIDGDFAPVLDIPAAGADPIIGDRALATNPEAVAALGRTALNGLHAGGIAGCIKHVPGHGRAKADSHETLPVVAHGPDQLAEDLAPFRELANAEMAMTAHIVFEALDPDAPATLSSIVIKDWIRGQLGFDGLLLSDDLDMKALSGSLRERAEKSIAAGCDIALQCTGVISDMCNVMEGTPRLEGKALARAKRVEEIARRKPDPFDAAEGWWRFRSLMGPNVGLRCASLFAERNDPCAAGR